LVGGKKVFDQGLRKTINGGKRARNARRQSKFPVAFCRSDKGEGKGTGESGRGAQKKKNPPGKKRVKDQAVPQKKGRRIRV